MDLNLEESSKAGEISSTGGAEIRDICQKITLKSLGCDFVGLLKVSFASDGLDYVGKYTDMIIHIQLDI
jgi:hypothetical protein